MAQFWTRKKKDYSKEKETMQSEDFLVRIAKNKEEKQVEKPKIENTNK